MFFGRKFTPFFDADPGAGSGGGAPTGGAPAAAGGAPGGQAAPAGGAGERTFSQAEVQSLIQTRLAEQSESLSKKYSGHDTYKTVVDRMAAMTGKTAEQISAELEAIGTELEARQQGIPPQLLQTINSTNAELDKLKAKAAESQLDVEEATLCQNPVYGDAMKKPEVKKEVREFATKTGVSLEQAFWATQGSKHVQQIERDTEQRIKTSMSEAAARGGVLMENPQEAEALGLTAIELAYCRDSGTDPKRYAALKNNNSIEGYRKWKKSSEKGA